MPNQLLLQQINKYFGSVENLPETVCDFINDISSSYDQLQSSSPILKADTSRKMEELNARLINEAEELKKSHSELGRILNSVNHGFFSRDKQNDRYTYLSPACERIYGYKVEEFFENNNLWFDVIHPDDKKIVEQDEERLNNEEELLTQYRIIHKNKSVRWLELKIIPYLKDGKLTRVDGVINDITQRKQVEAEREAMIKELLRSNADLKQFSFITSHNLRAPLSNILGILNLLDTDDSLANNKEMLQMVNVSANQLNKTINDLSKILLIKNTNNPDLVPIDLQESFEEVSSTFRRAMEEVGAEIITDFSAPFIVHNKVYLESIFVNLISNSIRYRSLDEALIIRVESFEDNTGNVTMKFSDNGTGIDLTRHKDKVFGLYQRFHENVEGQGLGLFIIKSQIEATGGKIAIESTPGLGTTFIISFKKQNAPKAVLPEA